MMPNGHCEFSPNRLHRYTLWRNWGNLRGNYVQFIGLNPSTADETQDDPTVRRCINYAKSWGYDGMCMTNAFAYRATDPYDMYDFQEPIGERNDEFLRAVSQGTNLVIACWGVHGSHLGRDRQVIELFKGEQSLHCLGLTKDGCPKHPLYLRKDLKPIPFPCVTQHSA